MPTYTYKCDNCGRETDIIRKIDSRNEPVECEKCGHVARRKFTFTTNRDWFREHWNDDITGEPILIKSKKHYRRVCKENGVMAKCLL